MAKGLRSSTEKANRSQLRSRIFGPVESARRERLSAKLTQSASKYKIREEAGVKVAQDHEGDADHPKKQTNRGTLLKGSRIDVDVARSIKGASSKTSAKNAGRVVKRGHGKASTAILFPAFKKQRARKSSESKGVKSSSIL